MLKEKKYIFFQCISLIIKKVGLAQWLKPVILTKWEVEIRKIVVQGELGQKVSEIPTSTNKKLGVVVRACHPSQSESKWE
jgi:hypothetical protein